MKKIFAVLTLLLTSCVPEPKPVPLWEQKPFTCERSEGAYKETKAYAVCHGIEGLNEKECVNFLTISNSKDLRSPYIQVTPMSGALGESIEAKFFVNNCL